MAGACGVSWAPGRAPELGYWIAAHRRRGFAGEITRALLRRVFTGNSAAKVAAWCRFDNAVSQRVLLRAGFRRTGTGKVYSKWLRRYVPAVRFAIARAEWARHRQLSEARCWRRGTP